MEGVGYYASLNEEFATDLRRAEGVRYSDDVGAAGDVARPPDPTGGRRPGGDARPAGEGGGRGRHLGGGAHGGRQVRDDVPEPRLLAEHQWHRHARAPLQDSLTPAHLVPG